METLKSSTSSGRSQHSADPLHLLRRWCRGDDVLHGLTRACICVHTQRHTHMYTYIYIYRHTHTDTYIYIYINITGQYGRLQDASFGVAEAA